MKLIGILGTGSGKLGSSVFAVSAGQQIVRQYQPVVSNPQTQGQTTQRARFKLMSQIAASLAPVIVIPRKGLQSSRNLFIKKNAALFIANDNVAQVSYENLQITAGTRGLSDVAISRPEASGTMSVFIEDYVPADISAIAYNVFRKNSEKQLELMNSVVIEEPGDQRQFQANFDRIDGELVVFAYGVILGNADARSQYDSYKVVSGTDIATLVASRAIDFNSTTFTKTRASSIAAGAEAGVSVPDGQAQVIITTSGPGTATGAGTYDIGTSVTATATPASNGQFIGWKIQGQSSYVSTNASYTFQVQATTDLIAEFRQTSGTLNPDFNG